MKKIICIILLLAGCTINTPKENNDTGEFQYTLNISNSMKEDIINVLKSNSILEKLIDESNIRIGLFENFLSIEADNYDNGFKMNFTNKNDETVYMITQTYFDDGFYVNKTFGTEYFYGMSEFTMISYNSSKRMYYFEYKDDKFLDYDISEGESVLEGSGTKFDDVIEEDKNVIINKLNDFKKIDFENSGSIIINKIIDIIDKQTIKYKLVDYDNDNVKEFDYIIPFPIEKNEPVYFKELSVDYYLAKRGEYVTLIDKNMKKITDYYNIYEIFDDIFVSNDSALKNLNYLVNYNLRKYIYELNGNFYIGEEVNNEYKLCKLDINKLDKEKIYSYSPIIEESFQDLKIRSENECDYYHSSPYTDLDKYLINGATSDFRSFSIYEFATLVAPTNIEDSEYVQYINNKGEYIGEYSAISNQFSPIMSIFPPIDNKIIVKKANSKYGMMDLEGNYILPAIFDSITIFNGDILVNIKNKWQKVILY